MLMPIPAASFPPNEIVDLLEKGRAGDAGAAQRLFDAYANSFRDIIRRRMLPSLRRLFGESDFLQETRIALYEKVIPERFFRTPQGFVAWLSKVVANKVRDANRKYLAEKNKLTRDIPFQELSEEQLNDLIDENPLPPEDHFSEREYEEAVRKLNLRSRLVVFFVRNGTPYAEIAYLLDISEKTVARTVASLREAFRTGKWG